MYYLRTFSQGLSFILLIYYFFKKVIKSFFYLCLVQGNFYAYLYYPNNGVEVTPEKKNSLVVASKLKKTTLLWLWHHIHPWKTFSIWPSPSYSLLYTCSSLMRSLILAVASSWARNRLMTLARSGSKMFPSSSRTTWSNSRILVWGVIEGRLIQGEQGWGKSNTGTQQGVWTGRQRNRDCKTKLSGKEQKDVQRRSN